MISWLSTIPPPPESSPESAWLWVRVVAFLGILGAGAYFLSAFNKKRRLTSTEKRQGKIFVADTCPLGNRQYLVVAQYGNEKHLLGVSTSSINHLSKLGSIPLTDIDSENQSSDENKVL